MAPVKQNYNPIHPLLPGPGRAVKYSCFLLLTREGLLWVLPSLPHCLEAGSPQLVGQNQRAVAVRGAQCPGL